MKKFNFFIAAYFIFLFLLFIINAILEASTEYALIMLYYPYLYYIAALLIIIKGWEVLIRAVNTFSNSLASLFGKLIFLIVGVFVTLWIFVVVLFGCGSASSEKYEDLDLQAHASPNKLNKTEYIVLERGVLAATTLFYHERHNLFLMKKKESYSHKI